MERSCHHVRIVGAEAGSGWSVQRFAKKKWRGRVRVISRNRARSAGGPPRYNGPVAPWGAKPGESMNIAKFVATAAMAMALAVLGMAAEARAEALEGADAASVRKAVEGHLAALAAGDAKALFELASPAARAEVGSPEALMERLAPVAWLARRADAATFSEPDAEGLGADAIATQAVRLEGGGGAWIVIFALQRAGAPHAWAVAGAGFAPIPTKPPSGKSI